MSFAPGFCGSWMRGLRAPSILAFAGRFRIFAKTGADSTPRKLRRLNLRPSRGCAVQALNA
eukprot:15476697-Alexandrium_andersonii.AAC.1